MKKEPPKIVMAKKNAKITMGGLYKLKVLKVLKVNQEKLIIKIQERI